MPHYEYVCQKCGETFARVMTFADKEKKRVACPECKSKKVRQLYSSVFTKTSRKS